MEPSRSTSTFPKGSRIGLCLFVFLLASVAVPPPALALQAHAASEGLLVHQMAHCFFLLSMGFLAYWLRQRGLTREPGWRYVRWAAFLFILWNINAIFAHSLEDNGEIYRVINTGDWNDWVQVPQEEFGLILLYYVTKLDHLLSLPGIILLAIGLRRLLRRESLAASPTSPGGSPS